VYLSKQKLDPLLSCQSPKVFPSNSFRSRYGPSKVGRKTAVVVRWRCRRRLSAPLLVKWVYVCGWVWSTC